ncbi:MAG: GNAT family N-acetyltransferase [Pseudomonadota bacterium]
MANPVILKTPRLILRPPMTSDAAQIAACLNDREVAWNLGRVPHPYLATDAEAWLRDVPEKWIKGEAYTFAVTHLKDEMVGCVSLRLLPMDVWEFGYWLAKPLWGLGLTSEAAIAVLDYAEDRLGLEQFSSGHFIDNPASGRILTKLGFEPVGETVLYGMARGTEAPCIRYTRGTDPDLALRLVAH